METVKVNTHEVLYHNRKFSKNYWSTCLPFELRSKYESRNGNFTLDYVILLKVPNEYFSSNSVDIISENMEKSLIDTWYKNDYSVEETEAGL